MDYHIPIQFITLSNRSYKAIREAFHNVHNVYCQIKDILDLVIQPHTMFVSPANSIGFMDGGIDRAYMQIFPGVEKAVMDKIKQLGHVTNKNRCYLSVGSAVIVPVLNNCVLVSTPTMFLPHDVSETRNAYHAMMASLMAFAKHGKSKLLITTSLCCGYGMMDPKESAKQMRYAYDDFVNGKNVPAEVEYQSDPTFVITQNRDEEQPRNRENREIHNKKEYHEDEKDIRIIKCTIC